MVEPTAKWWRRPGACRGNLSGRAHGVRRFGTQRNRLPCTTGAGSESGRQTGGPIGTAARPIIHRCIVINRLYEAIWKLLGMFGKEWPKHSSDTGRFIPLPTKCRLKNLVTAFSDGILFACLCEAPAFPISNWNVRGCNNLHNHPSIASTPLPSTHLYDTSCLQHSKKLLSVH